MRIEYIFVDAERQTIPFVKVTDAKGAVREYSVAGTTPDALAKGEARTMDCIDCHNVVAHRMSPTPQQAVDAAIASGRINRGLPFVRREGVRLVGASHSSVDEGAAAIDDGLRTVLFLDRPCNRRVRHRCRGGAADDLSTECLSYDEGDVRNVS